MTPEQITTILTTLIEAGGIATFFSFVVRGLRKEIGSLNKTIEAQKHTLEAQNKTLEVMEKRISETEKVGDIYKRFFEDFPAQVDNYKSAILKLKDEKIKEYENALASKNDELSKIKKANINELIEQENILSDIQILANKLSETSIPSEYLTELEHRLYKHESSEFDSLRWNLENILIVSRYEEFFNPQISKKDSYKHEAPNDTDIPHLEEIKYISKEVKSGETLSLIFKIVDTGRNTYPSEGVSAKNSINGEKISIKFEGFEWFSCSVKIPEYAQKGEQQIIFNFKDKANKENTQQFNYYII